MWDRRIYRHAERRAGVAQIGKVQKARQEVHMPSKGDMGHNQCLGDLIRRNNPRDEEAVVEKLHG